MNTQNIVKDFQEKVCSKISLFSEGINRYKVFTPFLFDDGDHITIVLKCEKSNWFLSDEGNTFMRLTYDIDERDLFRGNRQKIITNVLSTYQVENKDGEFILPVEDNHYGDALYTFIQALMKISDVTYLSRELVRSTFYEDFKALMSQTVPPERLIFDWYDKKLDPQGLYSIDCRINGMKNPLFVFALQNDDKTRDATIALQQYEKWEVPSRSLSIFEDQESINRKVLARFTDVCEKQYSSLGLNKDRIVNYINIVLESNSNPLNQE